jgi:hypothetical protein
MCGAEDRAVAAKDDDEVGFELLKVIATVEIAKDDITVLVDVRAEPFELVLN